MPTSSLLPAFRRPIEFQSLPQSRLAGWGLLGIGLLMLTGCQTTTPQSTPLALDSLQEFKAGPAGPQTPNASNTKQNSQAHQSHTGRSPNRLDVSSDASIKTRSNPASAASQNQGLVFRGQDYTPSFSAPASNTGPNGFPRQPVPATSANDGRTDGSQVAYQDQAPLVEGTGAPGYFQGNNPQGNNSQGNNSQGNNFQGNPQPGPSYPPTVQGNPPSPTVPPGTTFGDYPFRQPTYPPNGLPPGQGQIGMGNPFITPPGIQNPNVADLDIFVREGQTGQFMIGAGINSDAGVTGQLTISERNFDILRFPRSLRDITSGEAFRGRGQSFRLEALPGSQVQRYLVSFGEPYFYLFGQPFSFNTSGYYFTRGYFDWNEQRLGGTVSLGYRLTQDVSLNLTARAEEITIFDPRLNTSPDLNAVLGDNELYTVSLGLTHDTRDHPFLSSQGHFLSLSFQQAFGNFDYPRGDFEFRKYWLLSQRADSSGKHTISHSTRVGVTGSQTPLFENYYAGGFSTMRGFDFRGASPVQNGVITGGEFQLLNTLEYTFPITADDMFKGVLFCDYGTVEDEVTISEDNFRVVPGFGFRINMPVGGAGGAPLAFDFGFPVASAATDDRRIFSFYMAVLR